MLQSHEDGGVRADAISAWARSRILDGKWITPIDMWFADNGQLPTNCDWDPATPPPTVHPTPHSFESPPLNPSAGLEGDGPDSEPTEPVFHYPRSERIAPFPSFRFAQMVSACFRTAFQEILYKPLQSIVSYLYDEALATKQDPYTRLATLSVDDLLTLLRDERAWYFDQGRGARLPHSIPFIPTSTSNMAPMTLTLLQELWREVCEPVFACRCTICIRALEKERSRRSGGVTHLPLPPNAVLPLQQEVVVKSQEPTARQIGLVETNEMETEEILNNEEDLLISAASPRSVSSAPTSVSRKRRSAELDDLDTGEVPPSSIAESDSPRKRQRTTIKSNGKTDDAIMSEPESPLLTDSHDSTAPASPAHSVSDAERSSSASDSSSLRSIRSGEPLTTLMNLEGGRSSAVVLDSKKSADKVQIHHQDEDLYGQDGVVRFMS